jgi:hypothetical protein
VSQENSIRMAAMCCLTVGGGAWRCKVFNMGRDCDRLDVFDEPILTSVLGLNTVLF